MIALRVTVPIACWRKAHARELLETEVIPPPSTCYGALLSLVGETDRRRHIGARVTAGRFRVAERSVVLRTLWRIKDHSAPQGNGKNARPDFQQILAGSDLLLICDRGDETGGISLEDRVREAFSQPGSVARFGGWCLGESTNLINDAWVLDKEELPRCEVFELDTVGAITLPVWVDHVGTTNTRYAVGALNTRTELPSTEKIPVIHPH